MSKSRHFGWTVNKLLPVGLFVLLILVACAPLNEAQKAEREYRRGEYRAKFFDYRQACEEMGGTVVIRSNRRIKPDRVPKFGDKYHCEVP
ncbi:MAG: hypothetical protein RIA65_15525 [Woeseia sp.]